jgi:histidinol-phosphate aminotransferase
LDESVALLASNEAPFAPLPEVVRAAAEAVASSNRYPDPGTNKLRESLSALTGVPKERVATGNGSCEILLALGEALLQPGRGVVHAWPSFSVYSHMTATTGADAIRVPLDADCRHDLGAMIDAVTPETAVLIICNPNNPTGTMVPVAAVRSLLTRVPQSVCVVLDEAYREFVTSEPVDATLELLAEFPNLVILRTFSKVYGLAALRVGYALCGSEEIRVAVDQVRQPFFCNSAAQAAAVEALSHRDEVQRRVDLVTAERTRLVEMLEAIGFDVAESNANFVWASLPDGAIEKEVVAGLASREILVRAGTALGEEGVLRITVGLPEQHDRLIKALGELLA